MTHTNRGGNPEEVVLGKTHFRIPGKDDLIAFKPEAIALDQRHRQALMAMSAETLKQVDETSDKSALRG